MATRPTWQGYLRLSLVSCPVALYTATSRSGEVHFNMLSKETHNRIKMIPTDPETGPVERSEIVKGYEIEKGHYVVITDDEIKNVRLETTRTLDIDALAPTVFASKELADFRRSAPEHRRNLFFSYWTLKEAYIKARGMGLSLPLDAFWFDLHGPAPLLRVSERCPDIPERWRFSQYMPTAEHRMAIAAAAHLHAVGRRHFDWRGRQHHRPDCFRLFHG